MILKMDKERFGNLALRRIRECWIVGVDTGDLIKARHALEADRLRQGYPGCRVVFQKVGKRW